MPTLTKLRKRSKSIGFALSLVLAAIGLFAHLNQKDPKLFKDNYYAPGSHEKMPNNLANKILPFHQVYEPRKIGFSEYKGVKGKSSFKKKKILLLWTPWNSQRNTINYYFLRTGNESFSYEGCATKNCIATHNRNVLLEADAILFHLLDLNLRDLPRYRHPRQLWILYSMEAPWLILKDQPDLDLLDGIFNLTMGYRLDSDIVVRYGFIGNSLQQRPEPDYSKLFKNKIKSVVWLSSDCNTDSKRENYVKMLKNYINVDVYGSCGNLKCYPSQSEVCYENILPDYKFYLSFENALCKDYVTEKFFNVFNYDIVPVVFGGAHYSKFVPHGTYIDTQKFVNPKDLAKELLRIGSDEKVYSQMLKRKLKWTAFLDPWTCKLCDKLHESHSSNSVITNVKNWFIDKSQCDRWNGSTTIGPFWQPLT